MTDDPTTKPCPYHQYPAPWCNACHGTGRVPMDTGELLEALALAWPGFTLRHYSPPSGGWIVELDAPGQRGPECFASAVSLPNALRAALRG